MPETTNELSKPLEDIRREVVEARNMTIKTDNALKNLHAELKLVAGQQQDFQKRSWFSSAIAYIGFIGLCVAGVFAISNAKASAANADRERFEKQVADLTTTVEKLKADATQTSTSEQSAAQAYKMMTIATGEERLKGVDALAKIDLSKLSSFQRQVLQDRASLIRKEVGGSILEKGKAAYRRNDWAETIEQLSRYLAMNPNDDDAGEAYFFIGNAYLQSRKFEDASKHLQKYVETEKKAKLRDFAMALLVQAYDAIGARDRAVEIAREALSTYPASEFRMQFYYRIQRANVPAGGAPAQPAPGVAPARPPGAPAAAAPAAAPGAPAPAPAAPAAQPAQPRWTS